MKKLVLIEKKMKEGEDTLKLSNVEVSVLGVLAPKPNYVPN